MCEFPGGFVYAIRHFIEKGQHPKDIQQVVQSLNEGGYKKFKDIQTIATVDFGPDGSGDILNESVGNHYGKAYNGLFQITADLSKILHQSYLFSS